MFEPPLTGFSYSFTDDGHYEEAFYRAISNRGSLKLPLALCPFSDFVQLWNHHAHKESYNGNMAHT